MNSFIKNLFTAFIFLAGFFVFLNNFTSVEAQTPDCQISSFSSRPPGWFNLNEYSDTPPPYIYMDIQTDNCNTEDGNILNILIKNLDMSVVGGPSLEVDDIQNIRVRVKQDGSTSQQGGSVNFESTNEDFTIPLMVGERGNLGSCESTFGLDDCNLVISIYNTSISGEPEIFTSSSTGIEYECDYLCYSFWRLGCPEGQGVAPNVLPYGSPNICSTDNTTINITTIGGQNTGGITPSEYSTEPLAPLPGFTGTPDLGQWLESLFTILIVIAGLLALIMIVVGGITYLTSESFGEKGKGKGYIINAITGLVLALGAWVILNTINPELAEDLNIKIPSVTLEGDTNIFGSTFTSGTTAFTIPADLQSSLGIQCPLSGGSGSVASIIDSFVGKTTYRFGGKGGHLPQGQNFTSSNGNSSSCVNDSGGQQSCGSFCPSGSICLDCSGFVNHVRRCAALQTYGGTSSMVGHSDAREVDMSTLSSNGQSLTVEGQPYDLQPGDILVWNGHVVVYYGGGQIAESQGSMSGLVKNSNIKKSSLAQSSYKNRITHIIKVNP